MSESFDEFDRQCWKNRVMQDSVTIDRLAHDNIRLEGLLRCADGEIQGLKAKILRLNCNNHDLAEKVADLKRHLDKAIRNDNSDGRRWQDAAIKALGEGFVP